MWMTVQAFVWLLALSKTQSKQCSPPFPFPSTPTFDTFSTHWKISTNADSFVVIVSVAIVVRSRAELTVLIYYLHICQCNSAVGVASLPLCSMINALPTLMDAQRFEKDVEEKKKLKLKIVQSSKSEIHFLVYSPSLSLVDYKICKQHQQRCWDLRTDNKSASCSWVLGKYLQRTQLKGPNWILIRHFHIDKEDLLDSLNWIRMHFLSLRCGTIFYRFIGQY